MTDSIFMTGVVDAKEGREVAILDIANTFLHAEKNERKLMLLRGKLAEIMVKIDPSLHFISTDFFDHVSSGPSW